MRSKLFVLVLLTLTALPFSLSAQVAEINPYAGFYWPGSPALTPNSVGDFQNNQLLGVRGGYYVTKNFEIGGNYGWSNHFQPKSTDVASGLAGAAGLPQSRVRANIWEAEFSYNLSKRSVAGYSLKPYVVAGAGGLTTTVGSKGFVINTRRATTPSGAPTLVANDVLNDNDTFFAVSYGGGVKADRLWGPMGVFGDFRGRTMPNFFSKSFTWPEVSAGLTLSWGERP
ncbi:MAG TPA: outer membrane beta-barrel protein [Terriglobia bacterium]|nr:outer membrane beta-barrel protein [Terriglobia bacterium]